MHYKIHNRFQIFHAKKNTSQVLFIAHWIIIFGCVGLNILNLTRLFLYYKCRYLKILSCLYGHHLACVRCELQSQLDSHNQLLPSSLLLLLLQHNLAVGSPSWHFLISKSRWIFLTQGLNCISWGSCICRQILYHEHHLGSLESQRGEYCYVHSRVSLLPNTFLIIRNAHHLMAPISPASPQSFTLLLYCSATQDCNEQKILIVYMRVTYQDDIRIHRQSDIYF